MENILVVGAEEEFVGQPSQLDEVDDKQKMTVAKTNELEPDEDEGKEGKWKWYIERNGTQIHIKKALKMLIPRIYFEGKEPQTLGEWFPPHLSGTHRPIS